jgi:hypothetical protein
LIDIL